MQCDELRDKDKCGLMISRDKGRIEEYIPWSVWYGILDNMYNPLKTNFKHPLYIRGLHP